MEDVLAQLDAHVARDPREAADLAVARAVAAGPDPWSRAASRHVTGSAVVVHPPTGRGLLRGHER
ncbi:MAG: NUDIX hydrolase, partial [Acidimicrobiia bacterium]